MSAPERQPAGEFGPSTPGQWLASIQPGGEELIADVFCEGLRVLLFGSPRRGKRQDLEAELQSLVAGAVHAASVDPGERPLPGPIHHAMAGLMDWFERVRGSSSRPLGALILYETSSELAFGCVADSEPQVRIDGVPISVAWVKLEGSKGRHARGFAMQSRPSLGLELEWCAGSNRSRGTWVHANWKGLPTQESGAPDLELLQSVPQVDAAPAPLPAPAEVSAPAVAPAESAAGAEPADDTLQDQLAEGVRRGFMDFIDRMAAHRDSKSGARPADASPAAVDASASQAASVAPSPHAPEASPVSEVAHVREPADTFEPADTLEAVDALESEDIVDSAEAYEVEELHEPADTAAHTQDLPEEDPEFEMEYPGEPTEVEDDDEPLPIEEPVRHDAAPVILTNPAWDRVAGDRVDGREEPDLDEALDVEAHASESHDGAETAAHAPRLEVIEGGARANSSEPAGKRAKGSAPDLVAVGPPASVDDEGLRDGLLSVPSTAPRTPRRLSWGEPSDRASLPPLKRWLPLGVGVLVLFAVGWFLGVRPVRDRNAASGPSGLSRAMRVVGLGAPRFECEVTSVPSGAWIAVDGKDAAKRTPAQLDLEPGEHVVTLSIPDLGSADFKVQGRKGEQRKIDGKLRGSLTIVAPKRGALVEVWIDGVPRGVAPITISDLDPGAHDVRFAAAGATPWGQTVRLSVLEDQKIVARPFDSPASGRLTIRATAVGEDGIDNVKGASVWIDGRRMGSTPITLELSSGPHSVRVEHRSEGAPIQVIDLPGGNERFATFSFGSGVEAPKLGLLNVPTPMPTDRPTVISAGLQGVGKNEVREMWLHVRAPDGPWRRYPMPLVDASGAVVGSVVFPTAMLDRQGRATFYVSASTTMGDDYFSEIQNARESAREVRPSQDR